MRPVVLLLLPLALAACEQGILVGPGPGGGAIPAPSSLASTTLDQAVELTWADDSYTWDPARFLRYSVWSAAYDLDADRCLEPWDLEGTTVAPNFTVGALANSAPRCFRVNGETIDGALSPYSPIRADTPRFGSGVLTLWAAQVRPDLAGFRFWRDLDGDRWTTRDELGWIESESIASIDLALDRDAAGVLWLTPVRAGVRILTWPTVVSTLADIDVAPAGGYARASVEAISGAGYVVEMDGPDGFRRYGVLRVIGMGADRLFLEFAFQGDPGNPELLRVE
ncbi:MAG TPA: hypothetical protein PLI93_00075 [Gemmatimonadales bacterium]|nr:hypothetical protein [Gemmatimonadota bacterium]HPF60426.1 hypothetical protein [Gemmatimonadales bacterium]HRX19246.1 hypothetical protein [Gemmatimonadales bacterium]